MGPLIKFWLVICVIQIPYHRNPTGSFVQTSFQIDSINSCRTLKKLQFWLNLKKKSKKYYISTDFWPPRYNSPPPDFQTLRHPCRCIICKGKCYTVNLHHGSRYLHGLSFDESCVFLPPPLFYKPWTS